MEIRLVPAAGFRLRLIQVGQLKNVSLLTRLRTLSTCPAASSPAGILIREFHPGVSLQRGRLRFRPGEWRRPSR